MKVRLLSLYFWLLMLSLLPLLLWQGKRTRERTPRLPEAAGEHHGLVAGQGQILNVLVLGESTAVGVGVNHIEQGIAGHLVRALSGRHKRPIRWQLIGQNGVTIEELRKQVAGSELRDFDVVVLVAGVNDAKALHSPAQWRHDLELLLEDLHRQAPLARRYISAMPPMEKLPALPQPLAHVMGVQATRLDLVTAAVAKEQPRTYHAPLNLPIDALHMASDGIHPSEKGYERWARDLACAITP